MGYLNQIEQNPILKKLRIQGFRLTKAHQTIVHLLSNSEAPLSLSDIQKNLANSNIRVDRTTVYRETLFLKDQKMICEIRLGGGKKGYKACLDDHHHHLICLHCNKVEEIVLRKTLPPPGKGDLTSEKFQSVESFT